MYYRLKIGLSIVWLSYLLLACSPCALHEARCVVAKADSLRNQWQIYGDEKEDSITLANAYHMLYRWRTLYPYYFTHACYHYGCLLREQENPIGAMEIYLQAMHTRTDDYDILGRVYSNVGDICHSAGEYSLSYDMFDCSANTFLRGGDTLSYFDCLSRMAYELAVLNKKDSCFSLLDSVSHCSVSDDYLVSYCLMTRAKAYFMNHQYDSTVYYAHEGLKKLHDEPMSLLLLAQSYSYLNQKDSATYYAKLVLANSPDWTSQNNALYILTNDDESKDKSGIREVAASRSDVQKLLEIRQGKLSQAVQLLKQDINRKSDVKLYCALGIILVLIIMSIGYYIYRKRQKHELILQTTEDLTARYQKNRKRMAEEIENNCTLLRDNEGLLRELVLKNYGEMYNVIDRDFYLLASKLRGRKILNNQEICFCILVLLNLHRSQIADLLHYAQSSIGQTKHRVAKKLGTNSKNLRSFLISMAIDEQYK